MMIDKFAVDAIIKALYIPCFSIELIYLYMLSYTGHPEPPVNVHFSTTIPSLTWDKNFNGGLTQTFVIQTANVQDNIWANQTLVNEFDVDFIKPDGSYEVNITGLSPGEYNTRIYAFNVQGRSDTVGLDSTFTIKDETGILIVNECFFLCFKVFYSYLRDKCHSLTIGHN